MELMSPNSLARTVRCVFFRAIAPLLFPQRADHRTTVCGPFTYSVAIPSASSHGEQAFRQIAPTYGKTRFLSCVTHSSICSSSSFGSR